MAPQGAVQDLQSVLLLEGSAGFRVLKTAFPGGKELLHILG